MGIYANVIALFAVVGLLALGLRAHETYLKTKWNEEVRQDNEAVYKDILSRINAETLDPSDDAGVLAELCRLAGYQADDPECSDLHRD